MLRPIPQSLLRDLAVIKVCTGVDAWQKPTWKEYTVRGVHIQNTNEVKKTADNTEIVLRAVLFVDSRRSSPPLDYESLMRESEAAGRTMRATVSNSSGQKLGDYEVVSVDPVPDVPDTRVHHVEIGLV